jgi:hypothetical protein
MSTISIIILISIFLIISVVAVSVIQKREMQKELLRQKVAQYRYRANQASNILGNFSKLPIGTETRLVLMQYCLANLKAIQNLKPFDQSVQKNIDTLNQSIQSPHAAADKQRLNIPADLNLLKKQITQLTTLAQFLLKINKTNLTQQGLAPAAVKKIMSLISESKICAQIQQGKQLLASEEYAPAQRSFILSQQMLSKIQNKNSRLQQLETELQQLIQTTPSHEKAAELPLSQAIDGDHDPEKNDLFGPRKKW